LDGSISEASEGHPDRLGLDVLNDVDPFTAKNIASVADVLYLHFPLAGSCGVETLAVSQEGFENYVMHEQEAGTNICELELKSVLCKDKERNFVVSPVVWIRSILEHSRPLRHLYLKVTSSSLARQYQLKELKSELSDLWARVSYWIADLLSFSEAENRLNVPVADDVPPFMSPFYFDSNEASFLGQLMLPNTQSLGDTMRFMLEDKAARGALEVCASHDLAPFLQKAFEVKHNFHKDPKFKKAKAQWVKKRENVMRKGNESRE
jgi:hypothetical protein